MIKDIFLRIGELSFSIWLLFQLKLPYSICIAILGSLYSYYYMHLFIISSVIKKDDTLFNDNNASCNELYEIGNIYKLDANINNKLMMGNTLLGVNSFPKYA